jgi:hemoglobin-like flavoprotein
MNERDVELFNDSIERCCLKPQFLHRFYALFLASSDKVARKFERTDMRKQVRTLKISLYIMMLAGGDPERDAQLERLARRHSRTDLDIEPQLYDLWLERLLQAVQECDSMFDLETEAAWRRVLEPGIEFMKSRY